MPSPTRFDRLQRYWQTVRHLRARQVVARIRLRAAARVRGSFPAAAARLYDGRVTRADLRWRTDLLGLRFSGEALRARHAVEQRESRAGTADIARGRFEFLNEPGELGSPPDWAAPSKAQLWRYHLHYFDFLVDFALSAQEPLQPSLRLVEHWIAANPIHGRGATPDAWHPYVASVRMVNWMLALSAMSAMTGAADLPSSVRSSLAQHAVFLDRNLETDVGGNHLLKNLKAMAIAGCFWTGAQADRWRQRFGGWFTQEIEQQVLADGGHYERSPMYHCQVLQDGIEVAALLAARRDQAAARLLPVLARMDAFLEQVTHPDGQIALFNDSALGVTPAPEALHHAMRRLAGGDSSRTIPRLELVLSVLEEQAEPPRRPWPLHPAAPDAAAMLSSSGYVTLPAGDADRFLLADVGAVCPDDLPAHAHADLLSFELSLAGRRLIVDSGVGEYASGRWRQYYRSTRAHNTVMVDDREQSECWGSFRVGRRARPVNVGYRQDHGLTVLQAEHTGYDHLPGGVRHRRRFVWVEAGGFWLIADALTGGGEHGWTSYCHFHPEAAVIRDETAWCRIARDEAVLDICWYGCAAAHRVQGELGVLQGWYAERFGRAVPASVLVLSGRAVAASFGYALIPRPTREAPAPSVLVRADDAIEVRTGTCDHRVSLSPHGRAPGG